MTAVQLRQQPPATENPVPTTPFSEPWLSNLRRGLGAVNGKPTLMSGFNLSPKQHQQIQGRLSTLRRQISCGPTDRPAIGIELAKLLAAFPTQDQSDTPASLRIEAYSDAIGDAPAWAVREARLSIVQGRAAGIDPRFAPTPPQLAYIVLKIAAPLRNDLSDLTALSEIGPTAPEPSTEASRERVAKLAADFKSETRHEKPKWYDRGLDSLAVHARNAGYTGEFDALMDSIPDATERTGTFRKLGA